MAADERRTKLLEMVRVRGFASLDELVTEMQVSESTVRRDLDLLEESGTAKRTHGGVFYTGPSPKLAHFDSRQTTHWEKKKQIAQRASGLINDSDTVLLDGGSTTYELAQLLVGRPLQVVTNSLPVANLFISSSETDLVVIGGYVHQRTGVSLGPYARRMLEEINVRRAVISVAGISEAGLFNSNLLLVETEQAMMSAAEEVIVVADSTKLGHQSLSKLCELKDIDVLVVDNEITEDWRSRVCAAEVKLVVAGESDNSKN